MTVNEDGYYKLHIFDLEGNCEVNAPQPPAGAVSSYAPSPGRLRRIACSSRSAAESAPKTSGCSTWTRMCCGR